MGKKKSKKKENELKAIPARPSDEDRLLAATKHEEALKKANEESMAHWDKEAQNKVANHVESTIIEWGGDQVSVFFPEFECPNPDRIVSDLKANGYYVKYTFIQKCYFPSFAKKFEIRVHPFEDEVEVHTHSEKDIKSSEKPEKESPEKESPESKGWLSAIIDFIKDPFGD